MYNVYNRTNFEMHCANEFVQFLLYMQSDMQDMQNVFLRERQVYISNKNNRIKPLFTHVYVVHDLNDELIISNKKTFFIIILKLNGNIM